MNKDITVGAQSLVVCMCIFVFGFFMCVAGEGKVTAGEVQDI